MDARHHPSSIIKTAAKRPIDEWLQSKYSRSCRLLCENVLSVFILVYYLLIGLQIISNI